MVRSTAENNGIRTAARTARIPLWKLADALGISENTLLRRLRHELPQAEAQQLMDIIRKMQEA